jgi:predicted nucleotidyltransferase component of viral defense system
MHREVLTKRAAELYWSLSLFSGFYLAGGTALALQIGHRISVDFDLFSDQDIERSLLPRVQRVFSDAASIAPLINNSDELTVLVDDVKITFLKYPFPTFDPFVIYDDVPLLSVCEIAATKAYTIGRRGAFKDYIDLYFILSEQHVTLTDIIDIAEKKFGFEFNSRLFLEQLVFLDDVEDTDIQFLKTSITGAELLSFFEANIRANAERF